MNYMGKFQNWRVRFEVTFYGNDPMRGSFREIKENRYFEKPSAKRSRKKAEGTKRVRKNMLKRFEREGY